jgi:hypothetical protein
MQAFLPRRDETDETVGLRVKTALERPAANEEARTSARCAIDPGPSGFGAEHRVRTGDLRLGKATLYQLS